MTVLTNEMKEKGIKQGVSVHFLGTKCPLVEDEVSPPIDF
jgi:hypothetical protein